MAIFGRKLVGKEVLKREPIGYEKFLPKFTNFLAMSWKTPAAMAASTITYSSSTTTTSTNNSEHDICKLCNTCASSPLAFEAEDQIF